MMLIRLAWRNIWRNKRRSGIVLASIIVGMTAAVFIDSLTRGFIHQMVQNNLGLHLGHLLIHRQGFNDNKTVHLFMPPDSTVVHALAATAGISRQAPRTLAFGLVSSATASAGVAIVGISPEEEQHVTTIRHSLTEGKYFTGLQREIVLSRKLADVLAVSLGDRVVAMASAADGTMGSELFRVAGIFTSTSSDFDRTHVYIPLAAAQRMLQTEGRLAEWVVTLPSTDSVAAVQSRLQAILGPGYEILSFRQLVPSLVNQIDLYERMLQIIYLIIGLAMIFGIINTMMMSVFERIREFGVLKATGMNNGMLIAMIMIEAAGIGLVGTVVGALAGVGLTYPTTIVGIDFASFSKGLASYGAGSVMFPVLNPLGIAQGGLIIFLVCIVGAVSPAIRAARLVPIQAINHL